jgi:hypothetical protein
VAVRTRPVSICVRAVVGWIAVVRAHYVRVEVSLDG